MGQCSDRVDLLDRMLWPPCLVFSLRNPFLDKWTSGISLVKSQLPFSLMWIFIRNSLPPPSLDSVLKSIQINAVTMVSLTSLLREFKCLVSVLCYLNSNIALNSCASCASLFFLMGLWTLLRSDLDPLEGAREIVPDGQGWQILIPGSHICWSNQQQTTCYVVRPAVATRTLSMYSIVTVPLEQTVNYGSCSHSAMTVSGIVRYSEML